MNRAILIGIMVASLTLTSMRAAQAQGRGGVSGGWGGVVLLLHPEVQKELKLDETQLEKSRALASELAEKQRSLFSTLEGLQGEERAKKAEELASAHVEEGMKALATILKPEQFLRFQQIDFQQRGAAALTDPKVARSLKLSTEQSEKINTVIDRSILRMREAPSMARGDRDATRDKIQLIRNETDARALVVLSEDQKLAWKLKIGEPFAMASRLRSGR